MDVAIVSLLSVILATLLAMPWVIFRMVDSVRKELTAKIDGFEARLNNKFDGLGARLTDKFDGLEARLTNKFDGLEARLTDKIDGLGHDVAKLSERVARIEGHLFGVERPNSTDSDLSAGPTA